MVTKRLFLLSCWIQIISFSWVQGEVEYQCGKTSDSPTFIVGGETTGTWPWMASLGYFDDKEVWIHNCGTTLIGQNVFLTAAHCVQELPPEWQILAGTDDLNLAKKRRHVKVYDIQDVVVHPQFNGTAYFDIALLRTKQVNFTERISPVCLPNSPSTNIDEYKNNLMYVTGWGSSYLTGDTSKSLKRVSVKVYSQSYCNRTHIAGKEIPNHQRNVEKSVPRLFQSQVICAGLSSGMHGSCKGDSGGPLLLEDSDLDSYFQIGVVHGGIAGCGSTSFPSIYVRLDDQDIFQFIKINTKVAEELPTTFSWELIPVPDISKIQLEKYCRSYKCLQQRANLTEIDMQCRVMSNSNRDRLCYCCGGSKSYHTFGEVCRRYCRQEKNEAGEYFEPCKPSQNTSDENNDNKFNPDKPFPVIPLLVQENELDCDFSSVANVTSQSKDSKENIDSPTTFEGQPQQPHRSNIQPVFNHNLPPNVVQTIQKGEQQRPPYSFSAK